jgi:hypothetical protein
VRWVRKQLGGCVGTALCDELLDERPREANDWIQPECGH